MIFSKSINTIKHNKGDYQPGKSNKKSISIQKQESGDEEDKLYSTPLVRKSIKKVIVLSNRDEDKITIEQPRPNERILNIKKTLIEEKIKHDGIVKHTQGSFGIYIRNLNDQITQNDLKQCLNDDASILGINISKREANITFTNKESADKAVDVLNNATLCGHQVKAVINYKTCHPINKIITLVKQQAAETKSGRKYSDGGLRMDKQESIFDRIQQK